MRWAWGAMMLGGCIMSAVPASRPAQADAAPYVWMQYAADGVEARAITTQKTCPAAEIDGVDSAMQVRAGAEDKFATTTCALAIPKATRSVKIGGVALKLPVASPQRIAIVGDTGCRLKGIYLQACNDPQKWPFRQVAASIAAQKPDLIIHVGDYHYRETACPAGDAGCSGSPFGDTWDAWRDDFFDPAAQVLPIAPWVMVRGNHEECARGGRGWSRALEASPYDDFTGCNASSPPFVVKLPLMSLAIIDTAMVPEPTVDEKQASVVHAQYAALQTTTTGPVWVLQHRPIWSTGGVVAGLPFGDNKTLALAARDTLSARVDYILSGHHHVFQVLNYADDLPTQIVVGHGGDFLNKGRSADPAGWVINGVTVKAGLHQTGKFGFAMMQHTDAGWTLTNFDQAGTALQHCDLKGRSAVCATE